MSGKSTAGIGWRRILGGLVLGGLAVTIASTNIACGADLAVSGGPPIPVPLVVEATPVIVPVLPTIIRPPAHPNCDPGYARASAAGPCLRHGELDVSCTPSGGCIPLPPDPLPYNIGPYYRLGY